MKENFAITIVIFFVLLRKEITYCIMIFLIFSFSIKEESFTKQIPG